MRKAIRTQTRRRLRLGLPAVAAAAAFALTGCGDGEAPFGADAAMPGAEQDAGGGGGEEPNPDDMPDIEIPGGEGTETPGGEPPDFEESSGGGGGGDGGSTGGGGGGTVPTVADLEGYWLTGSGAADSSLSVSSGTVSFIENTEAEGDVCSGTATDGAIALDYCTQFGSVAWSSMSAALEMSGSTLIVTWDDGTVQEYTAL